MSEMLSQAHIQQPVKVQTDYSEYELKMSWRLRWFLVYLYASALILSIAAAVIIATVTRNVVPSFIPAPLLLSMKPIVNWAFSQRPL